jgi:hypothetical protein
MWLQRHDKMLVIKSLQQLVCRLVSEENCSNFDLFDNACRVNKKNQHLICIFYWSLGRVVLKKLFVWIQIRLAVTDRTSPADLPFFLCLFCLLRDPILFLKLSIILTEHILVSQNDKIMWLFSFIIKHCMCVWLEQDCGYACCDFNVCMYVCTLYLWVSNIII